MILVQLNHPCHWEWMQLWWINDTSTWTLNPKRPSSSGSILNKTQQIAKVNVAEADSGERGSDEGDQ